MQKIVKKERKEIRTQNSSQWKPLNFTTWRQPSGDYRDEGVARKCRVYKKREDDGSAYATGVNVWFLFDRIGRVVDDEKRQRN